MPEPIARTCEQLLALLTSEPESDLDATREPAIEAHIATCPNCASSEQMLTTLLLQYRQTEIVLADDIEQRLLSQMCESSKH